MASIPFSQRSIAVTLLNSAAEQTADAANYLERAGDKACSRELYALERRTQSVITKVEAKLCKTGASTKTNGAPC